MIEVVRLLSDCLQAHAVPLLFDLIVDLNFRAKAPSIMFYDDRWEDALDENVVGDVRDCLATDNIVLTLAQYG